MTEQPWMGRAACSGCVGVFFPGRGEATSEARAVCAGCEVRADCLEYAMSMNERFGIWGGLTERERQRLRRARRTGQVAATHVPDVKLDRQARQAHPKPQTATPVKATLTVEVTATATATVTTEAGDVTGWRLVRTVERPALPGMEPNDGKAACPICGQRFVRLEQHLRQRHGHLAAWIAATYGLQRQAS